MLKDCTGKEINVGCYIRHMREPLPKESSIAPGTGNHAHNFFGVKEVKEVRLTCFITKDNYVGLGSLSEVVDGPAVCEKPYIETLRNALLSAA